MTLIRDENRSCINDVSSQTEMSTRHGEVRSDGGGERGADIIAIVRLLTLTFWKRYPLPVHRAKGSVETPGRQRKKSATAETADQ